MAFVRDLTRCSRRECHVTGYDVVITDGVVADTVTFALVDPCNTMTDACRAKAILRKVYKDWLVANEGAGADAVDATCNVNYSCVPGGPNESYVHGTFTLTITNTVTNGPMSPTTVTVPLPLDCDVPVTGLP